MKRFSTGLLPDPEGHKYIGFQHHRAFRAGLIQDVDLNQFSPPTWNQGATGSCVGHGTAGAIATSFSANNQPLPSSPRPKWIYDIARIVDRTPNSDGSLPALEDNGAHPNQMVRAAGEWGVELEGESIEQFNTESPEYVDFLQKNVNCEPNFLDYERADSRLLIGFKAIEATGDERIRQISLALVAGHAVMSSVAAGSAAFQGYTGGENESLGYTGTDFDHWVYFNARKTVNGKVQLRLKNSWGQGLWTPSGDAWVNEDFIRRSVSTVLVADLGL
jgi:hypothetical protein